MASVKLAKNLIRNACDKIFRGFAGARYRSIAKPYWYETVTV